MPGGPGQHEPAITYSGPRYRPGVSSADCPIGYVWEAPVPASAEAATALPSYYGYEGYFGR